MSQCTKGGICQFFKTKCTKCGRGMGKTWRCPLCLTVIGLSARTSAIWCYCTITPTMTTPVYMESFDIKGGGKA